MKTMYVFPTPPNAAVLVKTDSGGVFHGHPVVHPSGRQATGIDFPDGHPNGNGANRITSAPGYNTHDERGILWLDRHEVEFNVDDITLSKAGATLPPLRVSGTAFVQG